MTFDVVTSATASKWKNENLVGGTYSHEAEKGGVIDRRRLPCRCSEGRRCFE